MNGIIENEGIGGFYCGLLIEYFEIVFMIVILFVVYELVKWVFIVVNEECWDEVKGFFDEW